MPREGESPSHGWRGVYGQMGVSTAVEAPTTDERACPECETPSPRTSHSAYWCPTHGTWRPPTAQTEDVSSS